MNISSIKYKRPPKEVAGAVEIIQGESYDVRHILFKVENYDMAVEILFDKYLSSWRKSREKDTADLVIDEDTQYFKLIDPIITLLSFMVELQFKAIILNDNDTREKGHNLKKLFKLLDPAYQIILKEEVSKIYLEITDKSSDGFDFYTTLENQKNVFTNWRYSFEKGSNVNIIFLKALKDSLYIFMEPVVYEKSATVFKTDLLLKLEDRIRNEKLTR